MNGTVPVAGAAGLIGACERDALLRTGYRLPAVWKTVVQGAR
ncbi:MAG: hypothetical protein ABIR58_07835 [Gemmatimonadaceae bacterium]